MNITQLKEWNLRKIEIWNNIATLEFHSVDITIPDVHSHFLNVLISAGVKGVKGADGEYRLSASMDHDTGIVRVQMTI